MPDFLQRFRRAVERAEVGIVDTPPAMESEAIPAPAALYDARPDVDYKAQAESLLRQLAVRDKDIAALEARLAAAPPVDESTPPPAGSAVERIDAALEENLRATNQRLRANLRAAEAMIALRDGVSVDELTVPWPKQTLPSAPTGRR